MNKKFELIESDLESFLQELNTIEDDGCGDFYERDFNSKQLKKMFGSLSSVWSNETQLRTWATIKILEELEKLNRKKGSV